MLPRLSDVPQTSAVVLDFLQALDSQNFGGDIAKTYSERLSMATDNSVYQLLPEAILYPKDTNDVTLIAKLANLPKFNTLSFTPRGGGTGTNGQALNKNIIVDLSRYMNKILHFDENAKKVTVQAGIVKDELNAFLKPYGLFFSPELSTSNRATIGGMINTDASGQGSLRYGKTSDHTLGLKVVLINGEELETKAIKCENFEQNLSEFSPTCKHLHLEIFNRCKQKREQILKDLPQLNRFLTGYDLKNVFNDDESEFNLTRIITGSEGTLAFVAEATLNLLPIPNFRTLINVKYRSFDAALRNAPFMVSANALSVETVDSKVLNLAKSDIVWHSVRELLSEEKEPILGLNIVEFAGDNDSVINAKVSELCQKLDTKILQNEDGIIGYQVCKDLASILKIYAMRKKAVGLLGKTKGDTKPLAFVEDTCVPPENLADYIAEFRKLLDGYGVSYGMFGHVDAGVLHVRPALNLYDKEQVKLFRQISDSMAELTAKYGGLLWGEHGKGIRSCYAEKFFTPELWSELRYVKFLFDPTNRLNPGKICTPQDSADELYDILSSMRADSDRLIPEQTRAQYKGALECNGNGLCFNFDADSAMCPSMKVMRSRLHSPKGRAGIVREWLTLLSKNGVNPESLDFRTATPSLSDLAQKFTNTIGKWQGKYDFSHEVKDAMDTCLACKACASQCPIKIDVASFRSKFFYFYHSRYLREPKDYVVANLESVAPFLAKKPEFFNAITNMKFIQTLAEKTIGMTALPSLSEPNLKDELGQNYEKMLDELETLSKDELKDMIFIVQDPFTSYYDAKVVADFVRLCAGMGFKPVLLPFKPNGKAQHIKGFLRQFARTAKNAADMLSRIAKLEVPLVGVDPAIVLCYRDEYAEILGENLGKFHVLTAHEWLKTSVKSENFISVKNGLNFKNSAKWHLFPHCTEQTEMPNSPKEWQEIFTAFNQELSVESVGCCGMAGVFGHEVKNQKISKEIYDSSWGAKLKLRDVSRCLVTGYSCRSQVARFEGVKPKHPVQALASLF
ncbi:FAD-binding and (Fe-S)-binding domain-containing protein [Campylobacter suis]|uniref:FAD-binding oxidoreductase n=1 Tax=Campylobacter suis TaxID=2790657 RepID=A0ABM8Q139_9BACT|nr:FAD-binding and (Fe-S)-binding domain-containing protein [Campylobacter suis]CAD7286482.1 hypothetical protein LMG8286_00315 [Campylobacter suis]